MHTENTKISYIKLEDNGFPQKLREIPSKPAGLYFRGQLPKEDILTIGIVGARNCTPYGREMAKYFARELSLAGVQIISGMASGIDSFAHWGALEAEAATFAVFGCGVDICYPRENKKLMEKILLKGGVLSEFSPGTTPLPAYFPQRNRIISGLCDGILLVEAREKSGSLITAGFGLEQGKDIFALPGRNTDALSRGCNRLIRQGAVLVEGPEDILEEYKISGKYIEQTKAPEKKTKISLETKEEIVYSRLSLEPKHPNDLAKETNLSPNEVMGALLTLELSGRICESGGGFYTVIL